jgi:SAM-dependent methyltransferase
MRSAAVSHALKTFANSNIDLSAIKSIDIGGTEKVFLELETPRKNIRARMRNLLGDFVFPNYYPVKEVTITENPLVAAIPGIKFFDKGFNAEAINTSSDMEADFLEMDNIVSFLHYFDLSVSFDTLEHVRQPFVFCKHLADITKPGGYIYLQTVFSWVYHPSPKDFFRFSPDGLLECFSGLDVEVIDCDWDIPEISSFIFLRKQR